MLVKKDQCTLNFQTDKQTRCVLFPFKIYTLERLVKSFQSEMWFAPYVHFFLLFWNRKWLIKNRPYAFKSLNETVSKNQQITFHLENVPREVFWVIWIFYRAGIKCIFSSVFLWICKCYGSFPSVFKNTDKKVLLSNFVVEDEGPEKGIINPFPDGKVIFDAITIFFA